MPVAGGAAWVNAHLAGLAGVPEALPGVQRTTASTAVPAAPRSPAPAVQTSRRDTPSMTLARPSVTAAPSAAAGSASSSPIAYSSGSGQVPGIVAGPGSPTVVQMTPAQALATPVLAPTATAVVQRADPTPAPAGPVPTPYPTQGAELDELARALFPKFQRQLRMEYVYEREARGLPFDR
jgi:ribonuclease E